MTDDSVKRHKKLLKIPGFCKLQTKSLDRNLVFIFYCFSGNSLDAVIVL